MGWRSVMPPMPSEAVDVSLLYGVLDFIVGAVGGLVWSLSAQKAAQGAAAIELPR